MKDATLALLVPADRGGVCTAGGGTGVGDGPAAEGKSASGAAQREDSESGEEDPRREFSGQQILDILLCRMLVVSGWMPMFILLISASIILLHLPFSNCVSFILDFSSGPK